MLALCRFTRFAVRNRTVHKTRHDLDRSHTSIMNKQKKKNRHCTIPGLGITGT